MAAIGSDLRRTVESGLKALKKTKQFGDAYEQFRKILNDNAKDPKFPPHTLTALRACHLFPHGAKQKEVYEIALEMMKKS